MIHYLYVLYVSLIFLLMSPFDAEACTQEQAFNKMMALGRAKQAMMSGAGSSREKQIEAADFAKEIGDVGQVLADGRYAEACKYYDAIARKYSVDMEEASKGMITMEQLAKDGGRQGGRCSQADASQKLMEITNDMTDKMALGEYPYSAFSAFMGEVEKHNDLMYTNPSAYCDTLDGLKSKYLKQ
jgi:hypothetical protein